MATTSNDSAQYLASPPEGQVQYGMDNGPNRKGELIAMAVVTTVVATTTVALRLFTRITIVRGRVSPDDYMVLAALIFSIATIVATLIQTEYGLGYHMWDILFSTFNIWYPVYNIISTGTYSLSIMFSKLSILFFYLRLSPARWFRWSTYILSLINIAYSLTYLFMNVVPCKPIAAAWDFSIATSTCLDPWASYWALSILNIVMDVCILVLPIPVILPLQMDRRQKTSLILLFAAGALVCGITIRRTILIPGLKASHDRTWDSVEDFLFSYAEMNAGVVCASIPALKPLFVRYIPERLRSRSTKGRSDYSGGTDGSNTVVEQNRSRRKRYNESFQLSSIDETSHTRNYSWEDEGVHMWHNRDDGFEKTPVTGSRPVLHLANPSVEEFRVVWPVYDARAMAASPKPTKKNGITVTRETSVRYERDW
ncbi:hypothetical protein G7054_g4577 [Neopestalotiopsis clavispora]|nr:hypothetical protein G7054_g4577 [Neopestalotiopsis clavispora]